MKITKINDKYYDLSFFNHPGGDTALWHSFGRDATILFKSHHPFISDKKLNKILEKFEIKKLPTGYQLLPGEEIVPKYNYNSQFALELKETVNLYFEKNNISKKATQNKNIIIIILLSFRLIGLWLWLSGYWLSLLIYPLSAWLAGSNTFHDACHFCLSKSTWINELFSCYF